MQITASPPTQIAFGQQTPVRLTMQANDTIQFGKDKQLEKFLAEQRNNAYKLLDKPFPITDDFKTLMTGEKILKLVELVKQQPVKNKMSLSDHCQNLLGFKNIDQIIANFPKESDSRFVKQALRQLTAAGLLKEHCNSFLEVTCFSLEKEAMNKIMDAYEELPGGTFRKEGGLGLEYAEGETRFLRVNKKALAAARQKKQIFEDPIQA